MPNRIVREGILSSLRVASLDWGSEVFYRRLMSVVDDYGAHEYSCFKLLGSKLYPVHDNIRDADIARWIAACEKAGLVSVYDVDGRKYIRLFNFKQQLRSESKCPPPNGDGWEQLLANDIKCNHPIANDIKCKQMNTLSVSVDEVVSVVEKNPPAPKGVPVVVLHESVKPVFAEWQKYRRGMGKKPKDWDAMFGKQAEWLAEFAPEVAVEIMKQSMRNNWRSLVEPKAGTAKISATKAGSEQWDYSGELK